MSYFPHHRCPEPSRKKRRFNESTLGIQFMFTFTSSIFRPRMRGSSANGLSLLVGEPPSTYSTILTPNPPVESRGLRRQKVELKTKVQ